MVQARAIAVKEDQIVRIALPLEEDGANMLVVRGHIFAQPETEVHIKFERILDMRREELDVVQPQSATALMPMEFRNLPRLDGHPRTEFQLHSVRIRDVQSLALIADLRPVR